MTTVQLPAFIAPRNDEEKVISVFDCEDYEAALVFVNGELVFNGNYWDFHSGCMGTLIGGEQLAGLWDSGIKSLATALTVSFERRGLTVVSEESTISGDQYDCL